MLTNRLEYKVSLKRHSNKMLPLLGLSTIIYAVNNLNNLIKEQISKMEQQSQLTSTLQEEVFDLKKRNYTKRSTRDCKSILSS